MSSESRSISRRCLWSRDWPPRSPDLSLLNYFLWGLLMSKVNSPRPATLNQLQANISEEVAQINPAMMRRAMLDMKAKTVKCNPAVGGEQPVILPQRPPDPATELCSSFYARGRLPHESKDSSIRT